MVSEQRRITRRFLFTLLEVIPHDLRLSRRLHRLLHQRQRHPGSAVGGGHGNAEWRIRTDAGASHSVLQEAYQGTTLMNDHMNGEFPVLKPGANAISWTGAVTKVVVRPNWRYL